MMISKKPHINPWFKNNSNTCPFDKIPEYWEESEVLTFICDLELYNFSMYTLLNADEKAKERRIKTEYFKKRFITSRSILKFILLKILNLDNISTLNLLKERTGRIIVEGRPDINISLSYSGSQIAISVGKNKIGSDMEIVHPIHINKIRCLPIFNNRIYGSEQEEIRFFYFIWTLIEAYSKLRNKNPYPYLIQATLPKDANFMSYCINQTTIFSLASDQHQWVDSVLWLDPKGWPKIAKMSDKTTQVI